MLGSCNRWRQWLILTLLTVAFVTPRMLSVGTNIVTETYRTGAQRLWSHQDLYAPPTQGADRFEYSPLFALAYSPLAQLPSKWQAFIWAAFNCALFWLGVGAWFQWQRQLPKWLIAGVLVCSLELNISVLYQQVNAALIGLTLWALAQYRDGKLARAGFILALITDMKILPGLFALALLFPLRPKYIIGLAAGSLLALLSPVIAVGWSENMLLHKLWLMNLLETWKMIRPVQLDVFSVLSKWGWVKLGSALRLFILALSLILLFVSAMQQRIAWYLWFAVGACCLLLVSPRSESPTFVLMAPLYIFLTAFFSDKTLPAWLRQLGMSTLIMAAFLVTVGFTDLWARKSWAPFQLTYSSKTVGTTLLWLVAVIALLRQWLSCGSRPRFLDSR